MLKARAQHQQHVDSNILWDALSQSQEDGGQGKLVTGHTNHLGISMAVGFSNRRTAMDLARHVAGRSSIAAPDHGALTTLELQPLVKSPGYRFR